MEVPKISVIMPVYNAEETVSRMIDTIIAQTFIEWELICIDDGSKDSSGVILDEYAKCDERIRVIHKVNEGVSAARQDGLNAVRGEYIIHADADDWVESTMLEEMYEKITKEDCDVVFCDLYLNNGAGQKYIPQVATSLEAHQLIDDFFGRLYGSCWNKLVKKACIDKYKIKFPKGVNYCEDLLFWIDLFLHSEVKVCYLSKAFYHYTENVSSITHAFSRKTYENYLGYIKRFDELLPEAKYDKLREKNRLSAFHLAFLANILSSDEIKAQFYQIRHSAYNDKSIKWRLGYICVQFGFYAIGRKLLKF